MLVAIESARGCIHMDETSEHKLNLGLMRFIRRQVIENKIPENFRIAIGRGTLYHIFFTPFSNSLQHKPMILVSICGIGSHIFNYGIYNTQSYVETKLNIPHVDAAPVTRLINFVMNELVSGEE